jgi:50S ribosomal protein L16 3-hydroxylase
MQLVNFDIDLFLRDFWQKKPLLIRNPWKSWTNPLEPDELAGLACEDGVEARLIVQGDAAGGAEQWTVEHGPLPAARFGGLKREPWTLLVQAADHHVPDVAALIEPFRFIPNWRIDDVMVSYATDGGGVGAHFDQYDVFLVQGLGKRRWQVGRACDAQAEFLPHDDLRLLANFEPVEEWTLEPGDILYVPPRVPHNGVAVGDDCMTYSIGFRAPSRSELIANWCDHVLADAGDDDRYADPALQRQDNPGEISAEALTRLHEMVAEKLLDRRAFSRWFGQYNTASKYSETDWRPQDEIGMAQLRDLVGKQTPLSRNSASRFSYIRQPAGLMQLFVDGQCYECTGQTAHFAEALCAQECLTIDPALIETEAAASLIMTLCNQGSVGFGEED